MTGNVGSLLLRPDPPSKLHGFVDGEVGKRACSLTVKAVPNEVTTSSKLSNVCDDVSFQHALIKAAIKT